MHASLTEPAPKLQPEGPHRPESRESRFFRWRMNLFPAYWFTGARVTYVSADFREAHVTLPLSWRTRNLVGTTYGGSLYSAADPFFMLMLMRLLGPDYIVWDKAGSIRYLKPGRGPLHAHFIVPEGETESIKTALRTERSVDRVYVAELKSPDGTVHARIERTVYIRPK